MSATPSSDTELAESAPLNAPLEPPERLGDARFELARQYLRGDGLEIGALHLGMLMPPGARARYVDRMSVPDLREHYPELAEFDFAEVDVIDDGERLHTVEPESQDFIVANHFFEHCQDPIGTLETHLGKLRPGGVLFYAIPDKRYTFDHARRVTTLQHLIDDHEHGPERSRSQHYLEWTEALLVPEPGAGGRQAILDHAAELERSDYSIHFHVWTEAELVELFFYCQEQLDSFEVEAVRRDWIENIFVLRKRGDAPPRTPPQPFGDDALAGAATRWTAPAHPTATPLAGLRARLDGGSLHAHWSTKADGIDGRTWVIRVEGPVTVPLILDRPMTLTARARLLPHDWRDSVGGLDAWIAVTAAGEQRRVAWRSRITPAMDPDGVTVEVPLPAGVTELQIGADQRTPPTPRTTGQLALVEPHLAAPDARPASPWRRPSAPPPPADAPMISVLCPVHDPPVRMLEAAIDSVLAQTHGNWELVLSDDGSRDPAVVAALQRRAADDERIHVIRRAEPAGISIATNAALERATGDYVALLDHDDLLDPHALARVAGVLARDPSLDMVYTDEAVIEDGRIAVWHFKTDWSPEAIAQTMYITHLLVFRRSLATDVGGFRPRYDGTQDYDLVLRLGDRTDRIAHIPEVLYYWRAHGSSTAGGIQAKPYAYAIQPGTIGEHLQRRGIDAEVQYGQRPGVHRVVHRVDPAAGISIVVAVADVAALQEAAESWASQPHRRWEAVVSAPAEQIEAAANALRKWGVASSRIVLVEADSADDTTAALRTAAAHARSDNLLLMRTPLLGLTHNWLARLLGYCTQPGIGAAAPVILSDDNRIAHAGIAIPDGFPLALLHGLTGASAPALCVNVVAAEGAIAVSAATFERLGGLDPRMGSVALADLCVRAGNELGLRTVVVSDARTRTIGPDRETNDLARLSELGARYAARHDHDPYYSPNFRVDRGDHEMPPLPEAKIG